MFLAHSAEKPQLSNPQASNPHWELTVSSLMLCDSLKSGLLQLSCYWVPPSWGHICHRLPVPTHSHSHWYWWLFLGSLVTTLESVRWRGQEEVWGSEQTLLSGSRGNSKTFSIGRERLGPWAGGWGRFDRVFPRRLKHAPNFSYEGPVPLCDQEHSGLNT